MVKTISLVFALRNRDVPAFPAPLRGLDDVPLSSVTPARLSGHRRSPLGTEQPSVAFRERVEKTAHLRRCGKSGPVQPTRKLRRSGISHRFPRTGSHPFELRIAAVGAVSVPLPSIHQLANQAQAPFHAVLTWTRRAGFDSKRDGRPNQLLLGNRHAAAFFQKMAPCRVMSQTSIARLRPLSLLLGWRRFHHIHGHRLQQRSIEREFAKALQMRWNERSDLTGHSRYCESTPRESSGVRRRSYQGSTRNQKASTSPLEREKDGSRSTGGRAWQSSATLAREALKTDVARLREPSDLRGKR
jgi:hypothetical protein